MGYCCAPMKKPYDKAEPEACNFIIDEPKRKRSTKKQPKCLNNGESF